VADRTPHLPDDDLDAGSFDGLGLETLTEGVHSTRAGWAEIESTASTRRHRRAWLASAAAVVIFVLIAGVIGFASSRDDIGSVDTLNRPGRLFPIPPADASSVTTSVLGRTSDGSIVYGFDYDGGQLDDLRLATASVSADTASTAGPTIPPEWPVPFEVLPFGEVYVVCGAAAAAGQPVDSGSPETALWAADHSHASLSRPSTQEAPCVSGSPEAPILAELRRVRLVPDDEFRRYLASHPAENAERYDDRLVGG
jgi:hypothetical protein